MSTLECKIGRIVDIEVVDIKGSNTANCAIVEINELSSCHGCQARMVCLSKKEHNHIKAINTIGAKVGEFVELEIDYSYLLTCTTIHYGLPLIGFLAGITLTTLFINEPLLGLDPELWQFSGGVSLLIVGGFVAYILGGAMSKKRASFAQIKKVAEH